MVIARAETKEGQEHFQYSLCRVVLMVHPLRPIPTPTNALSVLALSSRFDGPVGNPKKSAE